MQKPPPPEINPDKHDRDTYIPFALPEAVRSVTLCWLEGMTEFGAISTSMAKSSPSFTVLGILIITSKDDIHIHVHCIYICTGSGYD